MIEKVKILQGHEGAIYKIVFDSDNRKLYSVGGDGWLVEWDVDNKDDGVLLARVPDQLFALGINSRHSLLGSFQGNFYILDRKNKSILYEERAHKGGVFSILMGEHHYYTFGGDGRIITWDSDTFEKVNSLQLSAKSLRGQALNIKGDRLAVGSSDGNIYILSFPDLYLRHQIESAHVPTVFTLVWMDDKLVSGGRDALLRSWKIHDGYIQSDTINAHWYAIYDLALTPQFVISSSRDKTIRWWSRKHMKPVTSIRWSDNMDAHLHSVNTLAYDPQNGILYSGSDDRTIRSWKMEDGRTKMNNER